ncbi:hypothetical protein [Bacillus thuringiensis]|uniref:hypothetical protein n=1 Tax=Bacillus thuringiensis TaxID=1428 RepID=UPI003CF07916
MINRMNPIKKYRFLAGMHVRKSLQELRVGQPYDIKQYGEEFFLRTTKGFIIILPDEMDKYFEPYVDYGFEGDGKYEDPEPLYKRNLLQETSKEISNDNKESNLVFSVSTLNENDIKMNSKKNEQLTFF